MGKFIDLTGQRFGLLIVKSKSYSDQNGKTVWNCVCDCGHETLVRTGDLRNGHTTSCGCHRRKAIIKSITKHGLRHTKIYHKWLDMKQRCFNPKNHRFDDWGGRGITVCDEWKNSFEAFYDYVSKLPHFGETGYSLDRINNDGNYEPGNVKWSTTKEQNNNKRNSKKELNNGTKNEQISAS